MSPPILSMPAVAMAVAMAADMAIMAAVMGATLPAVAVVAMVEAAAAVINSQTGSTIRQFILITQQ